ncbi:MAG: hypothetical protein HWE08_13565 [Alphaproteobacteria bacterium]|nr:hypothetical protein [Alphaproteobacteria bacterium]
MIAGPLQLYDSAVLSLVDGSRKPLSQEPLTALLLKPTYVPDLAAHTQLTDVEALEANTGDYRRLALTGPIIRAMAGGASFSSDPISWGNPVSLPPVKYLLLAYGAPGTLSGSSSLLGVLDLAENAPAVEAVRSSFTVTPPAGGWFILSRA